MQNEEKTLTNVEANSMFWDSAVDTFYEPLINLPNVADMYKKLTQSILSNSKFDAESTVLMDFACGNGAISVALAPHCKTIVGVDISQGMIKAYNQRMQDLGITNVRGIHAELRPDEPQLVGQKFDAILCAQSYKHIEDNVAITRVLKSFLKPHGVLLVIDTMRDGDMIVHVMDDMKSLMHKTMANLSRPPNMMSHMSGFDKGDMEAMFDEAGLSDVTFEEAYVKEKEGKRFSLFLARGVNSA